jgi:hypothetical protein
VQGISNFAVEDLEIRYFTQIGLSVLYTDFSSVISCNISNNGSHGIMNAIGQMSVQDSTISWNGKNGIDCSRAAGIELGDPDVTHSVTISHNTWGGIYVSGCYLSIAGAQPATISDNGGTGITAELCAVDFDGPATITDNGSNGIKAWNGGEVRIKGRDDLFMDGHFPNIDLRAAVHGFIHGYSEATLNSTEFECSAYQGHGVCDPNMH